MDRSQSAAEGLACPCGAEVAHVHWSIIDENARPDLVEALRTGDLRHERCPVCQRTIASQGAVTVIREAGAVTAAVMFADDEATIDAVDQDAVTAAANVEDVRFAAVPFMATSVVLSRDLASDVADMEAALDDVEREHGGAAAYAYAMHLKRIAFEGDAGVFVDVFSLIAEINDADEFAALIASRPDLLDDAVLEALAGVSEAEPEQAPLSDAAAAMLLAARTDPHDAWRTFTDLLEQRGAMTADALGPVETEIDELLGAGRFDDVIAVGRGALARADELGSL